MQNISAVIMGGGRGSRLFPLTHERAKPAVGFAGKYRLIDIPISNCINSGIKRIFVLTQFLSASLHRHIMQTYQFDTFTDGFVEILAAEQTLKGEQWFQGTADAVRATLNHTTYYQYEQMLILSGDHLYRMNYKELIEFHRENKADITIPVYPVLRSEASQFGLLKADESGMIQEFVEKPDDPETIEHFTAPENLMKSLGLIYDSERYLASMGIYVFEPNILVDALSDMSKTDFGKDVIPSAIKRYKVMAYPFGDYWMDIGTIGAYFDANISLVKLESQFRLYAPNWPIYTRTRSLPPARVIQSEIGDCLLVEGSDIVGAKIVDSIVGIRANIREGTCLSEVIMLGADFFDNEDVVSYNKTPKKTLPLVGIGKNCIIERAIIDKNARIGDGVIIHANPAAEDFEGKNYWIKDGITIIPRGAVIPAGTIIKH